jgi:hypothetical protein
MFTWYILQHDYCCNQNCCCIFVSYLPWQPQLLCCIFGQLHKNCTCFVCIFLQTSSTRLCTLLARECYARKLDEIGQSRGFRGAVVGNPTILERLKTCSLCSISSTDPSDKSVMHCSLTQFVCFPCDNKHVSMTLVASC